MQFQEITLRGNHYSIGYQFGSLFKSETKTLLEAVLPVNEKDLLLKKAEMFVPMYKRYMPSMLDEQLGIADGAGISLNEALYLQTRWDIRSFEIGECTSFAICGEAAENGTVYAGMNKDVSNFSGTQMVLTHIYPDNEPSMILVSYYGSLAGPGMNEYGVCFFGNALFGGTPGYSIPQPLKMRVILQQKSSANALNALKQINADGYYRFAGSSTVCDAYGDMFCFECLCGPYDVIRPTEQEQMLVHSNHVISSRSDLLALDHPEKSGNTIGRRTRMLDIFRGAYSSINKDVIASALRDHVGGSFGICRHNGVLNGSEPSSTAMSCIALPAEKTIYFAKGNPCIHPYIEYRV